MFQKSVKLSVSSILSIVLFIAGCSAQQTEEQALQSLRQMTSTGKLPPEEFVTNIESRFAGKRTGALAKLLHARIRFENNDFVGAAALLNSDVFGKKTKVADHALWLRGRALQQAGNHAEAMTVFADIEDDHRHSVRSRDAKLLWAASAIAAGRGGEVPSAMADLTNANDADALLAVAEAYETTGSQALAVNFYRRTFFFGAGSTAAKEAEAKLTAFAQPLIPQNAEEQLARAERLLAAKSYAAAGSAYNDAAARFSAAITPQVQLQRLTALANAGRMTEAINSFNALPEAAREREEGHRQMVLGYAKSRMWPQARAAMDDMRKKYPAGALVPRTMVDAGLAARDAKNKAEESYYFGAAVAGYPKAVEVAQAQFELAWLNHESGSYALSSQMFIEHLARYADKDNTNRGKAGYWAARDSERAGKTAEACALYEGVIYRYGANWYGHLARGRLTTMRNNGNCRANAATNPMVEQAVAN
ncbi:MAG: hypothetical protein ABR530_11200, partial [Pyrinomonadaceae bacterium]